MSHPLWANQCLRHFFGVPNEREKCFILTLWVMVRATLPGLTRHFSFFFVVFLIAFFFRFCHTDFLFVVLVLIFPTLSRRVVSVKKVIVHPQRTLSVFMDLRLRRKDISHQRKHAVASGSRSVWLYLNKWSIIHTQQPAGGGGGGGESFGEAAPHKCLISLCGYRFQLVYKTKLLSD